MPCAWIADDSGTEDVARFLMESQAIGSFVSGVIQRKQSIAAPSAG